MRGCFLAKIHLFSFDSLFFPLKFIFRHRLFAIKFNSMPGCVCSVFTLFNAVILFHLILSKWWILMSFQFRQNKNWKRNKHNPNEVIWWVVCCCCSMTSQVVMQHKFDRFDRRSNFHFSSNEFFDIFFVFVLFCVRKNNATNLFVDLFYVRQPTVPTKYCILTSTRFSVLSPFVSNFTMYFISIFVWRPNNALTLSINAKRRYTERIN